MSSKGKNQIIVKRNAPNWPAMVRKSQVTDNENSNPRVNMKAYEQFKNAMNSTYSLPKIQTVDQSNPKNHSSQSNLWAKAHYFKNSAKGGEIPKKEQFASKSQLVRQCLHCQVLYTNFHQCHSRKPEFSEPKIYES